MSYAWRSVNVFEKSVYDAVVGSRDGNGVRDEGRIDEVMMGGLEGALRCEGRLILDPNLNVIDHRTHLLLTTLTQSPTAMHYNGSSLLILTTSNSISHLNLYTTTGNITLLVKSVKLVVKVEEEDVKAMDVYKDKYAVVGLKNGSVYLFNFSKDKTASKPLFEGTSIIGVSFRLEHELLQVYIVTSDSVYITSTSGVKKGKVEKIDEIRASLMIKTPSPSSQEIVLANTEAIHVYSPEGRGPCFIIDGEKKIISWFKGYLVVITREESVNRNEKDNGKFGTLLTIYDLKSKYIAFRDDFGKRAFDPRISRAVGEEIENVLMDETGIVVITTSRNIFKLTEFDLHRKLDLLYSKNLYSLSINILLQSTSHVYNMTKSKSVDELLLEAEASVKGLVMDTSKRYADYLYNKGEYDAAMKQYIKTIGYLQPSFVILKYLDAQRIANLTLYLQALHDKGKTNPNHTALLLNCYTILNDIERLDRFIEAAPIMDIDSAIEVCLGAGHSMQALKIAERFEQHDWYVKIQVENLSLFKEAIVYLGTLEVSLMKQLLLVHGHILVTELPEEMHSLLLKVYGMATTVADLKFYYRDRQDYFLALLDAVITAGFEGVDICDTWLNLAITLRKCDEDESAIISFMKTRKYDEEEALCKCLEAGFLKGCQVVHRRLKMIDYYLHPSMDLDELLLICREVQEESVWRKAFEIEAARQGEGLVVLLEGMEGLLSDVEIIKMMTANDVSLGSVRPYLQKTMLSKQNAVKSVEEKVRLYSKEREKLEADIKDLQYPITFQAVKCELCKQMLELPSVHFLCKHSFHSKCLGDMTEECPRCGPERHFVEEMIKSQKESTLNMDLFREKVKTSGFAVVAEYIAKGVL